MAIVSKIETTSNVTLKLISRINLGRRGAGNELWTLDTAYKLQSPSPASPPPPPPTMRKELSPGQQRPIIPTGNINNPGLEKRKMSMTMS